MRPAILPLAIVFLIPLITTPRPADAAARDFAVEVSATVQTSPPRIDLSWRADPTAERYYVFKKGLADTIWGEPVTILEGSATEFSDSDVAVGEAWEYSLRKNLDFAADTLMVPGGLPVTFTIFDSWNDGMCCHHGLGSYEVSGPDQIYAQGGAFGASESTRFVAGAPEDPLTPVIISLLFDVWSIETSWTLTRDDTGATLGSGGPWPMPEFGHIVAGIEYPEVESRGSVLILVADDIAGPTHSKVQRLELDLICDGYRVYTRTVELDTPVPQVKSLILDLHATDPELASLLLLGNLPVPYSGNEMGAHADHHGAWPADLYYGELDATWTDVTVDNTSASRPANHNVPGDGKFDQTWLPSDVDLQVGRVDLSDMPAFSLNEIGLLRQYLDKNHAWRRGEVISQRRGLIDDNVDDAWGLAFAASGWRNFATMFGHENVEELDYFTTMDTASYLWSYGCGGGSYVSCGGVGTTADFASNTVRTVFTMLYGSYFGDWDVTDNILRAPLGAMGHTLTNVYSGRPIWHVQHMALGFPIGYSTRLTQNNNHLYTVADGGRQIHIALMGDPTLKMHVVVPPADLAIEATGGDGHRLNWSPSSDDILGYHIYRAGSLHGTFERLNEQPVTTTGFLDPTPLPGNNVYLVRALKLELSGSGTYYNLSGGIIDSLGVSTPVPDDRSPTLPRLGRCYPNPFNPVTTIHYQVPVRTPVTLRIFTPDGRLIRTLIDQVQPAGNHQVTWDGSDDSGRGAVTGVYCYTIRIGDFRDSHRMILLK